MVAETDMSGFARSVAVTRTVCVEEIARGAVYKPDGLTEPAPAGVTDHDASEGLQNIEVGEVAMQGKNCLVCPPKSVAVRGLMEAAGYT